MPTIVNYLGLAPGNQAQGTSLLPAVLEGKSLAASFAYMETLYPKTALGWAELRAVRTDEWKYVSAPKPELYHLAEDPSEARSLQREPDSPGRAIGKARLGNRRTPRKPGETGGQPSE